MDLTEFFWATSVIIRIISPNLLDGQSLNWKVDSMQTTNLKKLSTSSSDKLQLIDTAW